MLSGQEKERLREEIRELGFDEARFCDLEPLVGNRLREWVERGLYADMEWMPRTVDKRLDPQLVLPDSTSAIMLGVNYLPADAVASSQKRWAKYALYLDYHDTVIRGLKAIGELLESNYGVGRREHRYYVDTGPVMERGWAAASGMGWQGKNGMLISRSHGNWLLLAAVFVKLRIEPDPPLKKGAAPQSSRTSQGLLCGKCVRCVEACPTGAILEGGLVDAGRCISYHTIENRGIVPRELRPRFGSRVYGCDICLDVCPWNRFAAAGRIQLLESRYGVARLELLELLRMSVESYQETFRKMPMKRSKLSGLKRNACIAAGNLLECEEWWPKALDAEQRRDWLREVEGALFELSGHEEPVARAHAVWALFRLKGTAAAELLHELRSKETDPAVLEEYASWGY